MAILGPRPTTSQRLQEWHDANLRRLQLEGVMAPKVLSELSRAARAAAKAYADDGEVGVEIALDGHDERLAGLLTVDIRRTWQVFGTRVQQSGPKGVRKDTQTDFANAQAEYLDLVGAEKVVNIAATTKRNIGGAIARGVRDGLNLEQIQKLIREEGEGQIGKLRSAVIARTEVHSAAAAAEDEMVRAMGLEDQLKKEWLNSQDRRVRDTHRSEEWETNQRIIPMNEVFVVGSSLLRYPGDPLGAAEEIIMCRCTLGYITPDPIGLN